ncbi:MAG: Holliday junction branch migration protein RuvA [Rickettsiales bacterium]|jgi:Holliday junction DNA helicase RuvA|nr:Holliday junction branch migration protein RuvA [Rickettsiales bacterium]
MIGKIQGLLDSVVDNAAIVMAGGVGYRVFMATNALAALKVGAPATLWIETHVREDHIHLYGFPSNDDLNMFNMLTLVQGVGPKVALAIMGTLPTGAIIRAIATGDKASLTAAPGVGGKVAERMITELKSKIKGISANALPELEGAPTGIFADAALALDGLGYKRAAILPALRKILEDNPALPLDQVITSALKVL